MTNAERVEDVRGRLLRLEYPATATVTQWELEACEQVILANLKSRGLAPIVAMRNGHVLFKNVELVVCPGVSA